MTNHLSLSYILNSRYVVYRVLLAMFMSVGVTLHIVSTLDTLGIKWFIYMTNQGIGFLTLHYLIYAGIDKSQLSM